MQRLDPRNAAAQAVAPRADRPAMAVMLDTPDARLIVFRIEPGQGVPPHSSVSTVILTVAEGSGIVSGPDGEQPAKAGDVIAYAPEELHGMRALDERLVILATIAPRPGERHA